MLQRFLSMEVKSLQQWLLKGLTFIRDVSSGKQFQMFWISTRNHSWTAWSWRWRHYDHSECLEPPAQWQSIISWYTWIFM